MLGSLTTKRLFTTLAAATLSIGLAACDTGPSEEELAEQARVEAMQYVESNFAAAKAKYGNLQSVSEWPSGQAAVLYCLDDTGHETYSDLDAMIEAASLDNEHYEERKAAFCEAMESNPAY